MAKTHKRVLSLVLSLVMVLSLLPIQAWAADPGAGSSQVSAEADGVVVNKEVTYDSGSYQLSLESYVTNEVTETETTTPLDIVLVLDVSGSMEDDMESYTYTSTGSQGWSYDDVTDWWSPTYYYKVGDQYYEVTGDYERKGNFPNRYNEYWLEYDYDGGTRLGNTARSKDATLWTGELYTRDQMSSIQKIAALKTAVNGFIGQVATNAMGSDKMAGTDDDITHKISIVKFADDSFKGTVGNDFLQDWGNYNYTQIVKDLTDVSGNGAETLKTAVNSLRAAGATSVDFGLELAEDVLNGSGNGASVGARDDAKQVVIVFTDGQPNHGSGFSESVAATAVNKAKDLKDDKVTVFTVGVFEDADPGDTSNKFNKYMHGVSSNYPNATAEDRRGDADWDKLNLGVRAENSNYYLAASSADDLNAVFSSIASSIGTSKVEATADTVLTDTLSEYFAFPEGFSDSSGQIKVTRVPVDPATCEWDLEEAENITGQVRITVDTEDKNIQVTGFDYTANAVTKTTAADKTVTWSGAKLVLTFPIVPSTDATWGKTDDYPTNSVEEGSQAGLTGYTVDDKPGSLTLDNSTGTGEDGSPVAPVSTYQVKYTWSGLPKDETLYDAAGEVTVPDLPTDSGYYISGQTYTVDPREYPVLYTHDDYGNVNGTYTFSGWDKTGTQTMVEGGVTISGTWTKTDIQVEQATITFVVEEGGVNDGTTTNEGPINRSFPALPDTTAATGYTFDGWYDAENNKVTTWPEKVTESATYTAKFSPNQFTVTWMNGGETLETDEGVLYGTKPSYGGTIPTKASTDSTDYTFAGWSEDPNATAADAKQVTELPAVTKDVTYYAIFSESARQYDITVNYKSDDGKTLKNAETATAAYNSAYDVTAQIPAFIQFEDTNYAKDTVDGAISGTVQGHVEITVIYSVDEIGVEDPDQPDTVPDKYQKKVTFDVVNGAWNDETKTQQAAVVTLYDSEGNWSKTGTGNLNEDQIPAVGEKPDIGYQAGSWDTTPTIKLEITDDRSFTYTYAPAENTVYTVKHYLENLDGTGYELADTETKYGTTGTTVNAEDKDYPGFTYDSTVPGTVTSGTIAANGTLVLKLYYTRNSYEVKYQYTGTVPSDATPLPGEQTCKYGETVTVAAAATAQGYTFSGWSTTDATISTGSFTMPAKAVTITGSFTANEYNLTVKHVFTDNAYAPAEQKLPFEFGKEIRGAVAHNAQGYTVSVAVEPQAASLTVAGDQRSVTGTMPASDVTITFTYTPITVTLGDDAQIVKVDGEGQALNGAAFTFGGATLTANGNIFSLEGKTVTYGQTYTITETAPVGYTGVEPFQVELDSDGESLKLVSSNSDVSINRFAITVTNRINQYDLKVEHVYKGGPKNGEAVIPATKQEYAYGASVTEAALAGSSLDAGYVFSDYVVVYHTAVAETLEEGQAAITGTMPASDVTITFNYAPRTDLSYTVNYLEQGTNTVLHEAKTVNGQRAYATVTEDSIAIAGYTVVAGQESQDLTISPEGENVITFYYTANTNTAYTVEHYKQNLDGTYPTEASETENLTGTTGATANATAKDFEGFTFDKDNASNEISGTIAADGSLVLKLYYTRNSYTVTYQYTGDVPAGVRDLPVEESYRYGETVAVMPEPVVAGYTFSGWDTADAAISEGAFTMPAKPVTITGSFGQNAYTVTYDLAGGTVAPGTELTHTGLALLSDTPTIPNPYKEGSDFIGWFTADGDKWSPVVTGNVTYVAQYKEIGSEYDVIYKVDGQEVMRFTYNEDQKVPVEERWAGASDWTTNDVEVKEYEGIGKLFTMPAHDVVFTATTQAQTDTTYQVIYHYVARDGSEGTDSYGAQNGEIGALVSGLYSASEKTTYQGQQYLLDKVTFNGVAVNGTETLAEGPNVIDIYYDIDTIGINDPDGPDGEPDKNQVIFTYESADSTMGTVNLNKVVVTKDSNGMATAPQATATPNTGYAFVKWTESSYGKDSSSADMSGLPLEHSKDTWFMAFFETEGGQVDPGPEIYPDIPVYFMAVNGRFPGGDYTVMVSADENGKYYLSEEDIQTPKEYPGFGPGASWTCNNVACAAPTAGTPVQSGHEFVVTFDAPAQPESYTVTYQWESKAPAGVALPTADTVPAGDTYGIKNPSAISWEDEDGYWTFLGWADGEGNWCSGTIEVNSDLTLRGTWDLQAKPEVEPQPPQQNERFFVTKNAMESVVTAGDTIHWIITIGNLTDENITLTVTDPLPGVMVTDETGAIVTTVTVPAQYHVILNASYVTTDADAHNTIYNTVVVSDGTEEDSDKSTGTKVEPQYFSVTWQNYDGTVLELDPQVEKGTMPVYNGSTPTRPSDMYYVYTFVGWTPTVSPVTGNVVYTATYQEMYIPPYIPPTDPGTDIDDPDVPLADLPGLNTVDHYAYIAGYEDGTVRPNNNITRAEVATIFFRLFTDEYRETYWSTNNPFSDVAYTAWYNNAVSTTSNAGIIAGYPDGTFQPNNYITRAEFATIAARFLSEEYVGPDLFTDISGHWAAEYINRAANAGWINGYPDGSFDPNAYITRAEAMTLVNNMLGRMPHEDHMLENMVKWPDNPETAWYYEAVQEATNGHDYDWYEEEDQRLYEIWTALQPNRDWEALEKEWSNAYSAPGGEVIG